MRRIISKQKSKENRVMLKAVLGLQIVLFALGGAYAQDLGFRYTSVNHNVNGRWVVAACAKCPDNNVDCERREKILGMNPDFIGACGDLRGQDLRGITIGGDLRGADFRGADLRSSVLDTSADDFDLRNTKFHYADMRSFRFVGPRKSYETQSNGWDGVDFRGADISNADFILVNRADGSLINSSTILPRAYRGRHYKSNFFKIEMFGSFELDENENNDSCGFFGCGSKNKLFDMDNLVIGSFKAADHPTITLEGNEEVLTARSNTYLINDLKRYLPGIDRLHAFNLDYNVTLALYYDRGDRVKIKVIQKTDNGVHIRNFIQTQSFNYERMHVDRNYFRIERPL